MKTIYQFKCFPPRFDVEDNYETIVLVDAICQTAARKFLESKGFFGIQSLGHLTVYVATE